jgi:hypothetical protein
MLMHHLHGLLSTPADLVEREITLPETLPSSRLRYQQGGMPPPVPIDDVGRLIAEQHRKTVRLGELVSQHAFA